MRRAYAYLLTARGIDRNIINAFVHKDMIYESTPYHNVVFVGYDNEGKAVHAHKCGSGSKTSFILEVFPPPPPIPPRPTRRVYESEGGGQSVMQSNAPLVRPPENPLRTD